jgi:hypothetical protein
MLNNLMRFDEKNRAYLHVLFVKGSSTFLPFNEFSFFFRPSTNSIPQIDLEPQFIHVKQPFAEMTDDIKGDMKAMIPRHLRKPWKLLHRANYGNRDEHLNAVRELSNITHNLRFIIIISSPALNEITHSLIFKAKGL